MFGKCDWAVMFILSRTGETFARLELHVGPGASVQVPIAVDWAAWSAVVNDPTFSLAIRFAEWQKEFAGNIQAMPEPLSVFPLLPFEPSTEIGSPWEPFADGWDWNDPDHLPLEDIERHEQSVNDERRA